MTSFPKMVFALIFAFCICAPVLAQADDDPYLLKRGDNEFGFWGGFSPKATTIFAGLRDDEAEDRKFFIAAVPASLGYDGSDDLLDPTKGFRLLGRLSPEVMGLKTEIYDPRVHYHQVRDKWIGVRTPDGR